MARDRAREPKKYAVIPGITHYGVYLQARPQATKLAIEWFDREPKDRPPHRIFGRHHFAVVLADR